jgi:hypothetical protein
MKEKLLTENLQLDENLQNVEDQEKCSEDLNLNKKSKDTFENLETPKYNNQTLLKS